MTVVQLTLNISGLSSTSTHTVHGCLGLRICCCLVAKLSLTLQWLLSMGFPRQEHLSCHFLLQGVFPAQVLNPCLLHKQVDSLLMSQRADYKLHVDFWLGRGPVTRALFRVNCSCFISTILCPNSLTTKG